MAILKKIYPIFFISLLASCEDVFTPDVANTPVLCVNSLITAGEPIEAVVSKSRLYTDTPDKSEVKDADLRIYVNGKLQLDSYIPRESDNIKIVVANATLGRAEADVTIPKAIPTPKVKWETYDVSLWENEYWQTTSISFKLNCELTIEDPAEENYYRFTYSTSPEAEIQPDNFPLTVISLGNLQYRQEPIFGEHIGIFESIMGGDSEGFSFFTDRQFAGKEYTLHLNFNNCHFEYKKDRIPECLAHLVINSISPSYYNWANYLWQRDNGSLPELADYGFGEPIWGYSNVSTGAGVVAAQSKSVCTIDLTDFIRKTIYEANK